MSKTVTPWTPGRIHGICVGSSFPLAGPDVATRRNRSVAWMASVAAGIMAATRDTGLAGSARSMDCTRVSARHAPFAAGSDAGPHRWLAM